MESFDLSWSDFKSLIDAWGISPNIRYTPKNSKGNYDQVWVILDGKLFYVHSGLNSGSSDLTDFESNYKPNSSQTWLFGKNLTRDDDTFSITAAASQTSSQTFKFVNTTFLWDAMLYVRGIASIDGDFVQAQIVDVDGVYYPAGTVIETTIIKRFIDSTRVVSAKNPDRSPSVIPAGLYLKVLYTEAQGIAKTVDINLIKMN